MRLGPAVIEELRVSPGDPAGLAGRSTESTRTDWLGSSDRSKRKARAEEGLAAFKEELAAAQELLFASDTWALLVVLQGLDAAGKDGTIKHVLSGVNPQGCTVQAFRPPSEDELRHDFLWRCVKALPARGQIGIFNRSYYEEVVVVRVRPELLAAQRLPDAVAEGKRLWQERFEDINAFERHLVRNGTRILKIFLHVSKEEQRRRLLARLEDPAKRWKLTLADVEERERFGDHRDAYERALSATSTPWAPWYVVPADNKPALRALVGGLVVDAIDHLDLRLPSFGGTEAELEIVARALRRA